MQYAVCLLTVTPAVVKMLLSILLPPSSNFHLFPVFLKEKKVSSGDETAVAAKLFTKELEQQKKELGEIKLVEKESDNILHFDGIKSNSNVRSEKRMSEEMKTESQDAQNLVKLDK